MNFGKANPVTVVDGSCCYMVVYELSVSTGCTAWKCLVTAGLPGRPVSPAGRPFQASCRECLVNE